MENKVLGFRGHGIYIFEGFNEPKDSTRLSRRCSKLSESLQLDADLIIAFITRFKLVSQFARLLYHLGSSSTKASYILPKRIGESNERSHFILVIGCIVK